MSTPVIYVKPRSYCSTCREKRPETVSGIADRPICYQCLMKRLETLETLYTTLLRGRSELEVYRAQKAR